MQISTPPKCAANWLLELGPVRHRGVDLRQGLDFCDPSLTSSTEKRTTVGRTIPGVEHHHVEINGSRIHYVAAGKAGSPVLLVHGFPETWWAFRKVIPLLAAQHRVFAVDLRGFGDSGSGPGAYDSKASAEDLHALTGGGHRDGQGLPAELCWAARCEER